MSATAAKHFQLIQDARGHLNDNPLPTQRESWLDFLLAMHEGKTRRMSGREFYEFLTVEHGWRNDLAQSLVVEYDQAMELLDHAAERSS